jgi:dienelactone hydrolase
MRTVLLACAALFLHVSALGAGTIQVTVRGHALPLAHVAAPSPAGRVSVLFLPGDGGWHGFAITIANRMASAGYDVYALDTRNYLEAFTGPNVLSVRQVASDLEVMAAAIRRDQRQVALVGWSEGAGLAVAAAAENPGAFAGVVVFGVPEQAALAWRLRDSLASLAGREPDEPQFAVAPLLTQIRRVPLVMIQATKDPFTPMDRAKALFDRASGPKRLEFVEARNHRFDGGTERFFRVLLDGLLWVQGSGAGSLTVRGEASPQS